jgi:IS5 family transposase
MESASAAGSCANAGSRSRTNTKPSIPNSALALILANEQVPAIDIHQAALRRVPHLVAADAAFYSGKNEAAAKAKGVKRVCVPNRSTKSAERRREQKKRWFRNGQKWRTGCEGRISVAKRRHGLNRSRYKGADGMKRWVGLGVIADNLLNIARALKKPSAS